MYKFLPKYVVRIWLPYFFPLETEEEFDSHGLCALCVFFGTWKKTLEAFTVQYIRRNQRRPFSHGIGAISAPSCPANE
jgi:hypothetical protein